MRSLFACLLLLSVPALRASAEDAAPISLHSSKAKVTGSMLRYEPEPHKNTLGYWTKVEDTASWEFETAQAGSWTVTMLHGCGNGSGGAEVDIVVDDKTKLPFTVKETGGFQNFVPVELGSVTLPAGAHRLAIVPRTKPGVAVMDVREITLKPAAAAAAPTDAAAAAKKTAAKPWEKEINEILARDAKEPPAVGGIVFAGSSSIRLWPLKDGFPDLPVVNRGFGGSCIADSTEYADRLIFPLKPRIIVFYAGDNDSARKGWTAEKIGADFQEFAALLRKELPGAKLICLPIKPSLQRIKLRPMQAEANRLMAEECARHPESAAYLDTATPMLLPDGTPRPELFRKDGLHVNEAGYAIWNKLLRPLLTPAP